MARPGERGVCNGGERGLVGIVGESAGDAKFSGARRGPRIDTNSSWVISGKGLWFTTVRVSLSTEAN